MKKTRQLEKWESSFGVEYTDRNIIPPENRIESFKKIVHGLKLKSILEVGCNVGHNLIALLKIGDFKLIGLEPLKYAVLKGRTMSNQISILEGDIFDIPFKDNYFDLVFTSGVLIHIHLKNLMDAIDELYRVSKNYILAIEYCAVKETTITYRGNNELLWKRNFKKHFLDRYPKLEIIKEGYLDKEDGFDRTHWWLFKK